MRRLAHPLATTAFFATAGRAFRLCRRYRLAILLAALLFGAAPAAAQQHLFQVGFDTDDQSSTGCSLELGVEGTQAGLEKLLELRVDPDWPPLVAEVRLVSCVSGTWDIDNAEILPEGAWNTVFNSREGGPDRIEGSVPITSLGSTDTAQIVVKATSVSNAVDALVNDGDAILIPEPVAAWGALAVLAVLIVLCARRRNRAMRVAALILVFSVVVRSGYAESSASVFVGYVTDWTGISPVASDPVGDTADPAADLVAFFAAVKGESLVMRIDVVDLEELLTIHVTDPESLITVGASPINVSGSVSSAAAAVTVNGVPVVISGGVFSAAVALEEGHNTIVARATENDSQATDSISVSLDLTPPYVTIESHTDGETVYSELVTVTGLVNDIVRGTIEESGAQVTVNGDSASISNRSYAREKVLLVEGPNTITVLGSDQVGNVGRTEITLNYTVPVGRRIDLVSGQGQSAAIGSVLPQSIVVRVVDDALDPVEDSPVVFRVTQGSGEVEADTAEASRATVVQTDAEGYARTAFRLGTRSGSANHKVRAKVVGYDDEAVFHASAIANIGNKISVNSGNNQRGSIGQYLPEPLVVVVTDDGANVVQGARVLFEVARGGGFLSNGQSSYEGQTDSDGRATIEYRLGPLEGMDAQRITATLIDASEGQFIYAGFAATAFVPGDSGDTTISGVVLDNQDGPLPGVTIRIDGADGANRQDVSDGEGQFQITDAPIGPVHLIVDGSTTTAEGEYPSLSYNLVAVAGVDNPLPAPIYMVKLDTEGAVYAGPEDVVLELERFPGFKLEIAADSVAFPDGSTEGLISVTPVNASKIPMAPPNGMQPQFIVTIQPTNTRFDPPAKLTLPNVDGHAPGTQAEMYSYDHDLEEFVSIGLGTVSEDGSVIASNPGVGVIKAGWHCGSQPGGQGCTHNCPECASCDASCTCYWDNGLSPSSLTDTPEDCKKPVCDNGPKQGPDPSDLPADTAGDCQDPICNGSSPGSQDNDSDAPANGCCKNGTPHNDPAVAAPAGVAGVNYNESIIAPTSGNWGEMTPVTGSELGVDAGVFYDSASDSWKAKVTMANSSYTIWFTNLAGGVASAANATAANCTTMISDLQALGVPGAGHWYVTAAVEAHERVHVTEWKNSLNPKFATMKATIEGLSVPHDCGVTTAASAKTAIKALGAYAAAINTAKTDAATVFWAIPDPNAATNAAEAAVVNPIIAAIKAKGALNPTWPAACK